VLSSLSVGCILFPALLFSFHRLNGIVLNLFVEFRVFGEHGDDDFKPELSEFCFVHLFTFHKLIICFSPFWRVTTPLRMG